MTTSTWGMITNVSWGIGQKILYYPSDTCRLVASGLKKVSVFYEDTKDEVEIAMNATTDPAQKALYAQQIDNYKNRILYIDRTRCIVSSAGAFFKIGELYFKACTVGITVIDAGDCVVHAFSVFNDAYKLITGQEIKKRSYVCRMVVLCFDGLDVAMAFGKLSGRDVTDSPIYKYIDQNSWWPNFGDFFKDLGKGLFETTFKQSLFGKADAASSSADIILSSGIEAGVSRPIVVFSRSF